MDEVLPLASRTGGWAGTERSRGLPVTGASCILHPLSTPACTEDKVANASEVPACVELTVKGVVGTQNMTRHSVMKARMREALGDPEQEQLTV